MHAAQPQCATSVSAPLGDRAAWRAARRPRGEEEASEASAPHQSKRNAPPFFPGPGRQASGRASRYGGTLNQGWRGAHGPGGARGSRRAPRERHGDNNKALSSLPCRGQRPRRRAQPLLALPPLPLSPQVLHKVRSEREGRRRRRPRPPHAPHVGRNKSPWQSA